MKFKKLFRSHHSFYTQKDNSLYNNTHQEQSSEEKGIIHTGPSFNNAPDFNACPYIIIQDCKQETREICHKKYESCTIYQRLNILIKSKPKTGLERFLARYPDYLEMFVGSMK